MEDLNNKLKENDVLIKKYENEIFILKNDNEIVKSQMKKLIDSNILDRTFCFYGLIDLPIINKNFKGYKVKDITITNYDHKCDGLIEFYEVPKDFNEYKKSNISCKDMSNKLENKKKEGLSKLKEIYKNKGRCCICNNNHDKYMNCIDGLYTCCSNNNDCLDKLKEIYIEFDIPILNDMHLDCDKYYPSDED